MCCPAPRRLAILGWSGNGVNWDTLLAVQAGETFGNYGVDGDFSGASSIFGACLRWAAPAVTLDGTTWAVDPGNDCAPAAGNTWNAIDDGSAGIGNPIVGHSMNSGETHAEIRLRFGAVAHSSDLSGPTSRP